MEALLTNRADVGNWCFILLIAMFSRVMFLLGDLFCKSVGGTLDKKNQQIDDE